MAKQILLYSGIYSDTAAQFLNELEANKDNPICVRVNCPGGDPYSTYGMIAKAGEIPDLKIQVDGQANSCAFFFVANAGGAGSDNVECLDVSTFIAHRAATWMEKYPDLMTDAIKAELLSVNTNLRGIIEKNLPNFEKVTGVKLDKMFSMDSRIDVKIDAKKALKMGLVSKVNALTTVKKKEITALAERYHIAAFSSPNISVNDNNENMENTPLKTLSELKALYPSIYAEAKAEGFTEGNTKGIADEKKRISGWNRFMGVDAVTAKAGIESGAFVDMDVIAEMSVKMASPEYLEALKKGNTVVPVTEAVTDIETKEQKEAKAMIEAANKDMGWK